jgi:hypothetical protein
MSYPPIPATSSDFAGNPFSATTDPVTLLAAAAAAVPIKAPWGDERRSGFDRRARRDRRGADRRVAQQPFDGPDRRQGDRREACERRSGQDRRSGLPSNLETLEDRRLMSGDGVRFDGSTLEVQGTQTGRNDLVVELSGDGKHVRGVANKHVGDWQKVNKIQKIVINGGDAADRIRVADGVAIPVIVVAGDGNDDIQTGAGDDKVYGGGGDDRIDVGGGRDIVEGNHGNDTLLGGRGNDLLVGGSGHDLIGGGVGNDELHANTGLDVLLGGEGVDLLRGDRDDQLDGGAGQDNLDVGSGGYDYNDQARLSRVTRFALVDADSGRIIDGYHDLGTNVNLDLAELPTDRLSVRAYVDGADGRRFTGSVRFAIDGEAVQLENMRPYAMLGDFGNEWTAWTPEVGEHIVSATPYQLNHAQGEVGVAKTVRLRVSNSHDVKPTIQRLALVDVQTGQPLAGYEHLQDGSEIAAHLLGERVDVRAIAADGSVESVRYSINGQFSHIENSAPFSLGTDGGGRAMASGAGEYHLRAEPFSQDHGKGLQGDAATVRLVVVNHHNGGNKENPQPNPRPNPGNGGNTDAGDWDVNRNDNGTATPRISMVSDATVKAGQALTVNAAASTLRAGDWDDIVIEWDFGDTGSDYNRLAGYNAAHVYTSPGEYTVTLRITDPNGKVSHAQQRVTITPATYEHTLYVDAQHGHDANPGTGSGQAFRTVAAALARADQLGGDTEVLLKRGQTHDVREAIRYGKADIRVAGYGAGAKPTLRYTGGFDSGQILVPDHGATNAVIEGLSFTSKAQHANGDKGGMPFGIWPVGDNVLIRNNEFLHLNDAINGNTNPTGLTVIDNDAPLDVGVRGYFLWLQGTDSTILGNKVQNSAREHVLRMHNTHRVLVAHNDFTNMDRRDVDYRDDAKGVFVAQEGQLVWAEQNVFRGPAGVGPLAYYGGAATADQRWEHAVFRHNVMDGHAFYADHGAHHLRLSGNYFEAPGITAIEIKGWSHEFNRGVHDMVIENNVVHNDNSIGRMIYLAGGASELQLVGNTYLADNLLVGAYQSANVHLNVANLDSFSRIDGNTWSHPGTITGWAQGGYMILGTSYSREAHLDIGEWSSLDGVGNDFFTNLDDRQVIDAWKSEHNQAGRIDEQLQLQHAA